MTGTDGDTTMTDQTTTTATTPAPLTTTVRNLQLDISYLMADALRPLGMTPAQYQLLSVLVEAGEPITVTEAARDCHVTAQTAHTAAEALVRSGMLRKEPQKKGKGRRRPVTVTTRGRTVLADARRATAPLDAQLAKALGQASTSLIRTAALMADKRSDRS